VVTLGLAWGTVRALFDDRVAGIAALLLACSPSFVFWTRMPAYVALPVVPLALGVVWAIWRWYRDGDGRYLVAAAFLTGIGIATKILFIWLPVSLGLSVLLLMRRHGASAAGLLAPWRQTGLWHGLAALAAFALGLGPFLVYNLQSGGGTVAVLLRNLTRTELYGVRNVAVLANLRTVFLTDLRVLMDGTWFAEAFGRVHPNALAPVALAASALLLFWQGVRGRLAHPRRVALVAMLVVAMTAQSAVTVSNLGANHLAILWPWPQVLIALAAAEGVGLIEARLLHRRATWAPALAALLWVAPLAGDLVAVRAYHLALGSTGGRGLFSDAIYALATDLDAPGAPDAVALDWGLSRSLQLLTEGRVSPEDGYTFSGEPGLATRTWIEERMRRGDGLYLVHAPEHTAFGGYEALFQDAAYRTGRGVDLWRTYSQRDGSPVILVYTTVPAATLTALPAGAVATDIEFRDGIRLLGYAPAHPGWTAGEMASLTLYWNAAAPPARDYTVFVHLSADDERIVAQHDGVPALGSRPTTSWRAGDVVADRVRLDMPVDAQPGQYRLWVGLYDPATGVRLPITGPPPGSNVDRALLATPQVAPRRP
jgi:hypothetical protein